MKNNYIIRLLIAFALLTFPFYQLLAQGISKEGCFDQSGHVVDCGETWYPVKDGVTYKCVCNCSGADQCVQASSSSSYSNSYSSGSGDIRVDVASAVIGGLFNALDRWLNSPAPAPKSYSNSTSSPEKELTPAEKAEIERKQAEYRQKVLEQINNATAEYSKQINTSFDEKKEATLSDMKTKYVRSESVKSIKQLNCAAYESIEAAKQNCKPDFNSLEGSMEQARSSADFGSGLPSDCPEIKYTLPDVTPEQPVGFQQVYYEAVRYKADSINTHVTLLKETNKEIQKQIEEKEAAIVKLKAEDQTKPDSDKLLEEAMKALNDAKEEQENVTAEIKTSEKNIELYDIMRSAYDVDKSDKSNQKNENK